MDNTARPAGLLRDKKTELLCNVEADISHIPESQLTRKLGCDGEMYYDLEFKLEIVCKFTTNHQAVSELATNKRQTVRLRRLGRSYIRENGMIQ